MDRRADPRDPSRFDAEVTFEGEALPRACTVVDISSTGARLRFADDVEPSRTLQISLPLIDDIKDVRKAEVRWARGRAVGILFIG